MSVELDRLCACYGVELDYSDLWGNRRLASDATRVRLLRALGIGLDSPESAGMALASLERGEWGMILPPVKVLRPGTPPEFDLVLPAERLESEHHWVLELESGKRTSGTVRPDALPVIARTELEGKALVRLSIPLPSDLPDGYHRYSLLDDVSPSASMQVIVCPGRCHEPTALTAGGRVWGPAIQLYALRSERNWGIGDFGDLEKLGEVVASAGAGILGVNPLHALFPDRPEDASPYRPSNRSRLNILYLDVEAIADFAECEAARELAGAPEFQARLASLRATPLVDYAGVAAVKLAVFELLYRSFRARHLAHDTDRARQFRAFQSERGEPLRLHALYEALQQHLSQQSAAVSDWPAWPEEYRDPHSPTVAAFASDNSERIDYFAYLQWQADAQVARVARRLRELGLPLGLFQDLAVGVNPGGSETWQQPGLHALDVRIGCPPDEFNLKGQEWGLPPWIPRRLADAAYGPFISTLRETMRHAGALRIDHVMGLMRLFWVPEKASPEDGTYVNYPFADLLGILALESRRNRCLVIGEDLGTVPDAVREAMAELGILAYRPMYFERTREGEFKPPSEYLCDAAVVVTTHDLPTLAGYWQGEDLAVRSALQLFPAERMRAQQYEERAHDRRRLLAALQREGLLPQGISPDASGEQPMNDALARAVHAFVARSRSKILMVQLEDLLGQVEQVNVPGTTDERYPNWRHKLPASLGELGSHERMRAVLEVLRAERGVKGRAA